MFIVTVECFYEQRDKRLSAQPWHRYSTLYTTPLETSCVTDATKLENRLANTERSKLRPAFVGACFALPSRCGLCCCAQQQMPQPVRGSSRSLVGRC